MAYHSTNEYVKLLQNVNLLSTEHWLFLEEIVKTGDQKISRKLLIKQCEKDLWILENHFQKHAFVQKFDFLIMKNIAEIGTKRNGLELLLVKSLY